MMTGWICVLLFLMVGIAGTRRPDETPGKKPSPPKSRVDNINDIIHGQTVPDPYRWLEDGEDPAVRQWVDAQNAYTRSWLDPLPGRDKIGQRYSQLLSVGFVGAPATRGGYYFYTKRNGLQNQAILYVRKGPQSSDTILVDPNRLSKDGTVALDWWYPSENGRLLAYGLSGSGDEQSTLHILNVETSEKLKDEIPRTRACSLAWKPDQSGFYYTRYPLPGAVPDSEVMYRRRIFYHALGTEPKNDPEIFGRDLKPQDWPEVGLSPNGRYLLVTVYEGASGSRSDMYLNDLSQGKGFVPVVKGENAAFVGEALNDRIYIRSNDGAPNYRLFEVDPTRLAREHWRELIPEAKAVLEAFAVAGDKILAHYLENASSQLRVFARNGKQLADVPLPTIGSVVSLHSEWNRSEVFFGFTSYTTVSSVYRYDAQSARVDLWAEIKTVADTAAFEIKQVWYRSKDGTRISMFLIHKKGLALDGNHPTLLTGYGGFNISQTPTFSSAAALWVEHGGVWAVPNLRGGGEYGEPWHQAGMLGKKQTVFDDFIAAAEWLIAQRYTKPSRLAISGGSNGGLLVGAALTQRPDLFAAVVCAVPLLDMIRYHRFLIAKLWVPEYGSADDPEPFRWLYAYSPYHRVKDGTAYPAILITTAESDSRVDPLHARKMAARLQAANRSERPILLRIEPKAGHGVGKPIHKTIAEQTDVLSFLFSQLGVNP